MSTASNLIKTVKNSEQAVDLFKDCGEVAIDALLERQRSAPVNTYSNACRIVAWSTVK